MNSSVIIAGLAPIVIAAVLVLCNTWLDGKKTNTYAGINAVLAGIIAGAPTMGLGGFMPGPVVAAFLAGTAVAQLILSAFTKRAT